MQFDPEKRPNYIFKFPFRFVKPYKHVYQTYAKQRWLNKNILAVLAKQFLAYSEEYFKHAIVDKKIRINGQPTTLQYSFKNSDLLEHETVREEPPILDLGVEIIHEDDQFLVVNKPPSMIVHTGGGYHYNTLMAILHYEMNYQNLYILHRIDRLTSGVVILAKKKEKTTKFHQQSMEEVMKKYYYARVSGNVKFDKHTVNEQMICLSHKEGVWSVYDPQTMKEYLNNQQPKQSATDFVKLWYDEETDSSLLQCYPKTGRTHQIRVHLKHLGHSILNDVVYGGKFVGNCIVNSIQKNIEKRQNQKQVVDVIEKRVKLNGDEQKGLQKQEVYQNAEWYQKWDYKTKPLQIMLHSFKYKFEEKQYFSKKPYWTQKRAINDWRKIDQGDKQQKQSVKKFSKQQKRVSTYQIDFLNKMKKEEKNEQSLQK